MAPNGTAASRKTPASVPSKIKAEDTLSLENLFEDTKDADLGNVLVEVKKKLPQPKTPANWTNEVVAATKSKKLDVNASATFRYPTSLQKGFPNRKPLQDRPEVIKCTHCKRAVARHNVLKHVENCLNKKQEKQRKKKEAKDARDAAARKEKAGDSDEEDDDMPKKTASKTGGLTASKKRKAAEEGEEGGPSKKKKKKDEPKSKAAKLKAPVDVEKQCGVELPQGGQCARSLTCKSHSMGAKRAVPGRSAPYDKLLAEYQRKNQAKLHKLQFDANVPNPDDENLPTGPVDSEEEKDAVMAAISRSWGGQPLYQPVHAPLRKKYEYNRMKSMMQSAFGPRSAGGIFGGTGAGGFFGSAPAPLTVDADGVVHARRGSVVPGARSMMASMGPSRKTSIASGA